MIKSMNGNWWTATAVLAIGTCLLPAAARAELVADFEDLTLAAEGYWNGSDRSGAFTSGNCKFFNVFTDWGGGFTSWEGWAYSNRTDTTTPGFTNQYSAYTGGGQRGSANYAVGYHSQFGPTSPPTVESAEGNPTLVHGAWFTNTTFAALSMLQGDGFAKKFGGDSGDDPDWFLLTITGYDAGGQVTGEVPFYLADYTSADNSQDYIVDEWTWLDLTGLGGVAALEFALTSSDTDPVVGMNTPAYFAMDDVGIVPEPSSVVMIVSAALCGVLWWRRRSRRER